VAPSSNDSDSSANVLGLFSDGSGEEGLLPEHVSTPEETSSERSSSSDVHELL
jgi:hypothetical protein